MKHLYYSILFCFILSYQTKAQQVYLETGLSTASFENYKNELGENTLNNTFSKPQEILLGTGIIFNIFKNKIRWSIGSNYNKYRINTSFIFKDTKTPIFYDLSFVSLKTGINISLLKISKFSLQVHSNYSSEWLTYGSYRYENEFKDLTKGKQLHNFFFNYHLGGGIEYRISKNTSFYINYNSKKSIQKSSKNQTDESYQIYTSSFVIGIILDIEQRIKNDK
ncbi:hypothetical protein [Thalassobellus citreus]|uniref:hypothetical protein n=1 Tax=Thalassobellus citreus TaxID=3367752 RepID=UPI00379EC0F0